MIKTLLSHLAKVGLAASASAMLFSPVHAQTGGSGVVHGQGGVGKLEADYCLINPEKLLDKGQRIDLVRVIRCKRPDTDEKLFYEFVEGGKVMTIAADQLLVEEATQQRLRGLTAQESDALRDALIAQHAAANDKAKAAKLARRDAAFARLMRIGAEGLAVLSAEVYDISEVTEGTGFRISVFNTGKKTIKYVNVALVGLNAVNDPVRDVFSRSASKQLRGIGPIEPDKVGAYEKDYMWMTDTVERMRITSIRLEYMDGTSKTFTNVGRITLASADHEAIFGEEE